MAMTRKATVVRNLLTAASDPKRVPSQLTAGLAKWVQKGGKL